MTLINTTLSQQDFERYRATLVFVAERLTDVATIDWVLRLKSTDTAKRMAILEAIRGKTFPEPWRSAWNLIEDVWRSNLAQSGESVSSSSIRDKIRNGYLSSHLAEEIADLVRPRIEVSSLSKYFQQKGRKPKKPKLVGDLLRASLTSGKLVSLEGLKIETIDDDSFLDSLANTLEAAITIGLAGARRLGWNGRNELWRIGSLYRVYYVPRGPHGAGLEDPDRYNTGIAPSVKLLHSVVRRLSILDSSSARKFFNRYCERTDLVFRRLCAALLLDANRFSAATAAKFSAEATDDEFWNISSYPEFAELRAARFKEFPDAQQESILERITDLPPRSIWSRRGRTDEVTRYRIRFAFRELRRIEVCGNTLPTKYSEWLAQKSDGNSDLLGMTSVDQGFPDVGEAHFVKPNPDVRFSELAGRVRLDSLEATLIEQRKSWEDDPSGRAADWIQTGANSMSLISDFESAAEFGLEYPHTLERFGWANNPDVKENEFSQTELDGLADRALSILVRLPPTSVRGAIDGLSHWLTTWADPVVKSPYFFQVWQLFWPFAVDATNSRDLPDDDLAESMPVEQSTNEDAFRVDTLNNPVGRMAGIFMRALPDLNTVGSPFETDPNLRSIRNMLISAEGRAGLVARSVLIESLGYFLHADEDWATEHLVTPLTEQGRHALSLWTSVARFTRSRPVIAALGSEIANRATDNRLDRDTRESLAFTLVIDWLWARVTRKPPSLQSSRITQMLRTIDDEVRSRTAGILERFVREGSASAPAVDASNEDELEEEEAPEQFGPPRLSAEELFLMGARPFLKEVWPQERSLATPGVSRALADLPAASAGEFSPAVDAIERYLQPFECWSISDFGFYGEEFNRASLALVSTPDMAQSLLKLFDLTIGESDGAIVPYDLAEALDHIRIIWPQSANDPRFRRLSTAARRS